MAANIIGCGGDCDGCEGVIEKRRSNIVYVVKVAGCDLYFITTVEVSNDVNFFGRTKVAHNIRSFFGTSVHKCVVVAVSC